MVETTGAVVYGAVLISFVLVILGDGEELTVNNGGGALGDGLDLSAQDGLGQGVWSTWNVGWVRWDDSLGGGHWAKSGGDSNGLGHNVANWAVGDSWGARENGGGAGLIDGGEGV